MPLDTNTRLVGHHFFCFTQFVSLTSRVLQTHFCVVVKNAAWKSSENHCLNFTHLLSLQLGPFILVKVFIWNSMFFCLGFYSDNNQNIKPHTCPPAKVELTLGLCSPPSHPLLSYQYLTSAVWWMCLWAYCAFFLWNVFHKLLWNSDVSACGSLNNYDASLCVFLCAVAAQPGHTQTGSSGLYCEACTVWGNSSLMLFNLFFTFPLPHLAASSV